MTEYAAYLRYLITNLATHALTLYARIMILSCPGRARSLLFNVSFASYIRKLPLGPPIASLAGRKACWPRRSSASCIVSIAYHRPDPKCFNTAENPISVSVPWSDSLADVADLPCHAWNAAGGRSNATGTNPARIVSRPRSNVPTSSIPILLSTSDNLQRAVVRCARP